MAYHASHGTLQDSLTKLTQQTKCKNWKTQNLFALHISCRNNIEMTGCQISHESSHSLFHCIPEHYHCKTKSQSQESTANRYLSPFFCNEQQ